LAVLLWNWDATPGRLSQAALFIKREGVYYYGQCSEICGVNHGFMPIVVKGLSADNFVTWVAAKLDDLIIE
jgi:heme/copper-type cytochrome/quinol oxidase subunit 2